MIVKYIFLITLLFLTPPLKAEQSDDFVLKGSLLYFAPSFDETYFVINGSGLDSVDDPTPYGKRINNPVGHNLGYRLEGIYEITPCVDIRLRWARVFAKSHKTVLNRDLRPQLWATNVLTTPFNVFQPYSGLASSHIDVMWQKAECLVSEKMWNLSCWHFLLREGIEWSYLRYHESILYQENSGIGQNFQFHGHTKGLGLQIGLTTLCDIWRGLSFKFLTTGSLIPANVKAKIATRDILGTNNMVTQSSFWKLLPEWTVALGLNYSHCLWGHPSTLEVGYEMTTYFRGVSKLVFTDQRSQGISLNNFSDFYVQGFYVTLGTLF